MTHTDDYRAYDDYLAHDDGDGMPDDYRPSKHARRTVNAVGALLLSGPLALAILLIVAGVLLTGCGSPTVDDPQQTCREAARYALEQVMTEPPTMTDDEAQAMLDDKCADVTPTERNAIVDSERSAAIARYLGQ